jgi:hypothetical protein
MFATKSCASMEVRTRRDVVCLDASLMASAPDMSACQGQRFLNTPDPLRVKRAHRPFVSFPGRISVRSVYRRRNNYRPESSKNGIYGNLLVRVGNLPKMRLFRDRLIKLYTCTTDEGHLLSRRVAVDFPFSAAWCHRCVMATGAAGVPDSIQAAAGFVPNRTPAQGSRLARDIELLHRSLPDGEDSRWKFVYRMA